MKTTISLLFSFFFASTVVGQTYQADTYDHHCQSLKKAEVMGYEMAYLDEGHGPILVLVHGIPTHSWLYRKMVGPLVSKGYRVIVPDMMGAGRSSKVVPSEMLSFEGQSKCLGALLGQLNIEDCTLVVHDAGGPWSWNFLAKKNNPVKRLVLLNTILYPEGFHPPVKPKKGGFMNRMIEKMYGSKGMGKSMIKSTLKSGTKMVKLSKEDLNGYYQEDGRISKELAGSFFGSLRDIGNTTEIGVAALMEQNIPILAVWGEKDKFLRYDEQLPRAMKELNLDTKNTHILVGCKHFIQEEAPDQIVEYIDDFLHDR